MRELGRLVMLLLALLVCAHAMVVGRGDGRVVLGVAVALVGVLATLPLWVDSAITASTVLLAGAYVLGLGVGRVDADPFLPLVVALLVAYAEAGDIAFASGPGRPIDRATSRRRLAWLGGTVLLGVGTSVGVLLLGSVPMPNTTDVRAIGLLAAAVAIAAPVVLLAARRD